MSHWILKKSSDEKLVSNLERPYNGYLIFDVFIYNIILY